MLVALKNFYKQKRQLRFIISIFVKKKRCSTRHYDNLEFIYNGQMEKVCIAPRESSQKGVIFAEKQIYMD